jgi:hypothetical protein
LALLLTVPVAIGLAVDRLMDTLPLFTGAAAAGGVLAAAALVTGAFTRRFRELAPLKEPDE